MLLRISLAAVVLTAAVLPALSSQTLYTVHGGVPGTSTVTELKGPPSLPFGYPGGPVVSAFPTAVPFACPTAGAIPTAPVGLIGDVAFDKVGDVIWTTDGATVTSYSPAGVPLASFPAPPILGPVTGMGFNSAAGVLYLTDGVIIQGVVPIGPPPCGPPFVLPIFLVSPSPGMLTDIEWDPDSATFFACDTLGFVTNITPAGAVGPFGIFAAGGLCAPPLGGPLQGLAVDTTAPGAAPVLYVTDGFDINRLSPPGVVAAPTFYTPAACFPVLAAAPINGLAFSHHPITFGTPCHTAGGMLPMMTSSGNSTSPGAITVGVVGAPPLSPAVLAITPFFGALGPPLVLKGCPIVALPTLTLVFATGPGGDFVLPLAFPPGLPTGVGVSLQWWCSDAGATAISPGLEMTVGPP